jgi:hypothetical protein
MSEGPGRAQPQNIARSNCDENLGRKNLKRPKPRRSYLVLSWVFRVQSFSSDYPKCFSEETGPIGMFCQNHT